MDPAHAVGGSPSERSAPPGPALTGLSVADPPERWRALGFAVEPDGRLELGGVHVALGAPGEGITGWRLTGAAAGEDVDGLPTTVGATGHPGGTVRHPNGALALDHVVVLTPDFDRTAAAVEAAGMPLRRVRHVEPAGIRQGFRRLGPAIFELVEAPQLGDGPARFWGLVVIVEDLGALAARLGDRLGAVRPAVQPGRHIATLRREAGLSAAVAFMDPERLA